MTAIGFVAAMLLRLPGLRGLARRSWCTEQRDRLRRPGAPVVWIHDGEKMPWALWGADHGFFELEWANRLPYLRGVATAP